MQKAKFLGAHSSECLATTGGVKDHTLLPVRHQFEFFLRALAHGAEGILRSME